MIRRLLMTCTLSTLLFVNPAHSADDERKKIDRSSDYKLIHNVLFGEAIFEFEHGQPYRAMAMLRTGIDRQLFGDEQYIATLYLADSMIGEYLQTEALALYQEVARKATNNSLKRKAWLRAARLAFELQLYGVATEMLDHLDKDGDNIESSVLRAQLALTQQQPDAAVQALQANHNLDDAPIWALYQYYNTAAVLLDQYKNKQGAALLHRITTINSQNSEVITLRDQANLSLGYSLLQLGQAAPARQYFEKIRLGGPMSNMALLGMGWSYAKEDNFERALVYWTELSNSKHPDTYFHEALLAVPYGYSKLDAPLQAAQHYNNTIKHYSHATNNIKRALKDNVSAKFGTLIAQAPKTETSWLQWLLEQLHTEDEVLLTMLLDNAEFQQKLELYRQLLLKHGIADRQKSEITQFSQHQHANRINGELAKINMLYSKLQQQLNLALQQARTELENTSTSLLKRHQAQLEMYTQQARFSLAQSIEKASALSEE